MDLSQAKGLFIDEAHTLLSDMEHFLLEIEAGEASMAQHIDAIFRAAHTIKGSAGLFGFDAIVAFTHNVESVLDKVRAGQLPLDEHLISLMLQCQDHIASLIRQLEDNAYTIDLAAGTGLLQALHQYLDPQPVNTPAAASQIAPEHWQIEIQYGQDVFRDGMDPQSQLNYLQSLGQLLSVELQSHFPAANLFDPESCYLQLTLVLDSEASKQQIEDVFEFIQDSSKISISSPEKVRQTLQQMPTVDEKIGTLLVHAGAVTERELQQALSQQKQQPQSDKTLGQVLIEQGAVSTDVVTAALDKQKATEHKRPADFQFLKVEARKLDELINLVGELVTAGAGIDVLIQQFADERLRESFGVLTSLLEQIRDGALGLRMVQVGESFSRLKRIVRDVSKELGKDIELTIAGADTELDKSMVEKLSDPLMHIVRNALDHGIENKEIRLYKGKPAQGQLKLSACHEAGSVVIEIADDGAGLNVERIRAKAIEKNIIPADKELTEEEVYKLIFAPGFSTAASVTNLSGRGVGMDVVKRNIEELRGQIQISSVPDQGTNFKIRLPLTLAIIDGFLVSVGDTFLVLPLNMVQECIEFKLHQLDNERNYLDLRGEVLPFIQLKQLFDLPAGNSSRENIVVVQYGNQRAGLVVDHLHGELQAVIKPLNSLFRSLKGIGGYTILGSGKVGLILDIPQLVQFATAVESQSFTH